MNEWKREEMRTVCDACESAAAVSFCASDTAALCPSCDHKVHMCNNLASRHVRVKLAESKPVPSCDISFFYCEIDGTSLCLQCDMAVHVGGKRTHGRYLLMRQRVEFPADKLGEFEDPALQSVDQFQMIRGENQDPQRNSSGLALTPAPHSNEQANVGFIDLNTNPRRLLENSSKED